MANLNDENKNKKESKIPKKEEKYLAKQANLELANISGSGPSGRIVKQIQFGSILYIKLLTIFVSGGAMN